MNKLLLEKWLRIIEFLMVLATFWACSDGDKTAGGITEDAGIIADLDVAGVSQKGPFVKGAAVTVQGIDCKTMELTGERFESTVKSDKGDYDVSSINLSSTCAVFEVSGYYLNEVTGVKSADKITLRTITNLKDRENVNVNVLTSLEYGRVMNLAADKEMSFAEAKAQAEKEVLVSFGMASAMDENLQFEDLDILEKGNENEALLAVSILLQGDEDVGVLVKRLEKFADDFAEDGEWKDSEIKTEIANWAVAATTSGKLDSIRKNIESWGYTDEIPSFEKQIENVGVTLSGAEGSNGVVSATPCKTDSTDTCEYEELIDERDGQVYKTVKIGNQVWMAENLNFKTELSNCYKDQDSNCTKYGRNYDWSAALDACPSGWHLPTDIELRELVSAVGGDSIAGKVLKSTNGWNDGFNGSDAYGFSAIRASYDSIDVSEVESFAYFWSSSEKLDVCVNSMSLIGASDSTEIGCHDKNSRISIRCLKDGENGPEEIYGTLTDSRDGRTYKTVKIGSQIWMAENLNYKTDNSYCYNDSINYCEKYGRLYTWSAAMDSAGVWSDSAKGCGYGVMCSPKYAVQGVCPAGWHLPDTTDWQTLITAVGGWETAGKKLKSIAGWLYFESTDDYGFSALPGGFLYRSGTYDVVGSTAYLWTSTENAERNFHAYSIMIASDGIDSFSDGFKDNANSVRCVEN